MWRTWCRQQSVAKPEPVSKNTPTHHTSTPPSEDTASQSLLPLAEVYHLRSRLSAGDALFPVTSFDPQDQELIADDPVIKALPDYTFTMYSLEPATLAFMKEMITRYRPATILEYGSGLSSAVLSRHQREVHGDGSATCYISIEQSPKFAEQTHELLRRSNTSEQVTMLVADIVSMHVHGRETHCYDLAGCGLDDVLQGRSIDLILIDGPVGGGPSGIPGARFATVPLLRDRTANGAPFFLDDAFRDTELAIARDWSQLDYLRIIGIKAVGKGMLIGRYERFGPTMRQLIKPP